jgi:hypothetical protein
VIFATLGVALWLVAGPDIAPSRQFDQGSAGQIVPSPPDPPPTPEEIDRERYRGRLERLLGEQRPDHDYSGEIEEADIAARESGLAFEWCVQHVAKHANVSLERAALTLSDARRGDITAGIVVVETLEVAPTNLDTAMDHTRRRQCAALLYLGL